MNPTLAEIVTPNHYQLKMQAAFRLVADPKDWRAPINMRVHPEIWDAALTARALTAKDVQDAVMFITATELTIDTVNGWVVLTSIGYRAGEAGDH